jgi:hypothetical protein
VLFDFSNTIFQLIGLETCPVIVPPTALVSRGFHWFSPAR